MNSDIERVILDYLCLSNYTASAAMFAKETHLTPEVADLESLPRASIKHAILRGDIAEAILEINEIDPEVSFFCLVLLAIYSARRLIGRWLGARTRAREISKDFFV